MSGRSVLVFAHGDRWLYVLTHNFGCGVLDATTDADALNEVRRSFPGWKIDRCRNLDIGAGMVDPWPTAREIMLRRRVGGRR